MHSGSEHTYGALVCLLIISFKIAVGTRNLHFSFFLTNFAFRSNYAFYVLNYALI